MLVVYNLGDKVNYINHNAHALSEPSKYIFLDSNNKSIDIDVYIVDNMTKWGNSHSITVALVHIVDYNQVIVILGFGDNDPYTSLFLTLIGSDIADIIGEKIVGVGYGHHSIMTYLSHHLNKKYNFKTDKCLDTSNESIIPFQPIMVLINDIYEHESVSIGDSYLVCCNEKYYTMYYENTGVVILDKDG